MSAIGHIAAIARHEVGRSVRDMRFAGAFAACLLLAVGSVIVNMRSYVQKKHDYDTSTSADRRVLEQQARIIMHYHQFPKPIAREPVLTQFIALAGEYDPDPRAVAKIEYVPWFQGELRKNPLPGLFFPVDLVFVFGLVMSLFVFALTYDSLSGDTQVSATRLMLAGPVSRSSFIIGKCLGALLVVAIPLAVSAAAAAVTVSYFGRIVTVSDGDAAVSVAFAVVAALYTCSVALLALMVAGMFRTSCAAMLCLVFVWLLGFVALPYSAPTVAHMVVRPPGVASMEERVLRLGYEKYNDGYRKWNERTARRLSIPEIPDSVWTMANDLPDSSLALYPQADVMRAIQEDWWLMQLAIVQNVANEHAAYTRLQKREETIATWVRRLSPYGCFLNASVALANTGFWRELQLREGAERYLREAVEYGKAARDYQRAVDTRLIPHPTVHTPSPAMRLRAGLLDITILAAYGVLAFLVCYRGFVRREIV